MKNLTSSKLSWPMYALITLGFLVVTGVILYLMGRVPICECGYVLFWEGVIGNAGNSQHLLDFYTFSHIIHGFIFFGILWKVSRQKLPVGTLFLIAVLIEIAWEILENTPWSINRYRSATVSTEYYGDSIINSLSDILVMIGGFWFAYRFSWKLTLLLFIMMELIVGFVIRDNLTLNIIMFLYPIEWIKTWQMGG